MKNQKLLMYVCVALVFLYLLNFRLTDGYKSGAKWTVYGSNGCGWTVKQVDYMKKNGISHTYIDCDKKDCGEITVYPTLKSSNGETLTGFNKV